MLARKFTNQENSTGWKTLIILDQKEEYSTSETIKQKNKQIKQWQQWH